MTSVVLRSSGYTWKCPECHRENYTGPAPAAVRCEGCHGEFEVKELHHRRSNSESMKEVAKDQEYVMMPLFEPPAWKSAEEDIPF